LNVITVVNFLNFIHKALKFIIVHFFILMAQVIVRLQHTIIWLISSMKIYVYHIYVLLAVIVWSISVKSF